MYLTNALLPLLRAAAAKNAALPVGIARSAVIMMSTASSSINENTGGGLTAYRVSKTALNMVMKNFSLELKEDGVLVLCMHPGWVRCDVVFCVQYLATVSCFM